MATIHATTMSPTKLELLAPWLPRQEWYAGPRRPQLRKAGGFRLDDPAGAVGIEFMIVNAVDAHRAATYHVPMTYRGAPLRGADSALIGTGMHGVLGERWIYDGAADPVLVEELARLLCGLTPPQHQSRSDEVDTSVVVRATADRRLAEAARVVRVLRAGAPGGVPSVTATWLGSDGIGRSGVVVSGT